MSSPIQKEISQEINDFIDKFVNNEIKQIYAYAAYKQAASVFTNNKAAKNAYADFMIIENHKKIFQSEKDCLDQIINSSKKGSLKNFNEHIEVLIAITNELKEENPEYKEKLETEIQEYIKIKKSLKKGKS